MIALLKTYIWSMKSHSPWAAFRENVITLEANGTVILGSKEMKHLIIPKRRSVDNKLWLIFNKNLSIYIYIKI